MSCATCGCLAFTISRTYALLPTPRTPSVSGNEAVSRVCPGSPLRVCNTSHKHWSTRLSWTLASSAVNSGGTFLNQLLAAICTSTTRGSRSNKKACSLVQPCCNELQVANWNIKERSLTCHHRPVLPQTEQQGHQRVSLLTTFSLQHVPNIPGVGCRGRTSRKAPTSLCPPCP